MKEIYVISDTHFGHSNMLEFLTEDGRKCREFASVEEMDECIVTRWNETVRQQDIVYHLGDVAMKRKSIATVGRCTGRFTSTYYANSSERSFTRTQFYHE